MPNELTPQEVINTEELLKECIEHEEWIDCESPRISGLKNALEIVRKVANGDLVEVVHAHWIKQKCQGDYGICSECGCRIPWIPKNYIYCPNCGALMDGKDEKDVKMH